MRSLLLVPFLMLLSCTKPDALEVVVTNAWAQPFNKAGTSAAVYMTIAAKCTVPDDLRTVRAPSPLKASLNRSRVVDNALELTPVPSIATTCGGKTSLKPMGYLAVVTGIRKPLGIGDRIPLTLSFGRAGDLDVTADITTLAVLEDVDPMRMHMGGKKHGGMAMHHMRMH